MWVYCKSVLYWFWQCKSFISAGLLISAEHGSVEEKRALQEVLSTALSKDYMEDWKIQNVSFVHNTKLESQFADKKRELKEKV